MARPKGFADWNPQPATLEVLDQVQTVLRDYRDYLPLTARQVFYRMVGAFDFEKTEQAYGRLCEYLVRARRAQMIPFDAIRDDGTAAFAAGSGYTSTEEWWEAELASAEAYRRPPQEGQPVALEVWCEAAGMAPQLARIAQPFGVPVYSTGGFSSVTVTREISLRAARRDVDTVFLHVGDFDPSGESIYEAMTQDAHAFFQQSKHWEDADDDREFRYRRVALTREQVVEYDLPTAPPKKTDTRSKRWVGETCQAEAMAPDDIGALVRQAIEDEYDLDVFQQTRARSLAEREELVAEVEAMLRGRDE